MKTALIALFFILSASSAFAYGNERVCPKNVLTCRLEKQPAGAPRVLLAETKTAFDGTNTDEPSIPPEFCTISTILTDDNGLNFYVEVSENELMSYLFTTQSSDPSRILPGEAAFNATEGKTFYYGVGNNVLSCTLSK